MRLSSEQLEATKFVNRPRSYDAEFQYGYTMVELITVMVIMGVLAAIALPKFFNNNAFEARGFYDQVISTLRYAQKAAIAQNQFVCVTFGANPASVTLTQVVTGSACPGSSPGNNLAGPNGQATYSISSNNVSFTGIPAAFSFDALGRPFDTAGVLLPAHQSITVTGYATPIQIEAETGYVH
jgi:MSHA pilin protein MshC